MLDDFLSAIDLPKSRIINYPRYILRRTRPVDHAPDRAPVAPIQFVRKNN